MKKIVPIAVGLALIAVWLFLLLRHPGPGSRSAQTSAARPLAPEFALAGLDGRNLALSNYRGKIILLDFWATWCAPCQTEIPLFVEWQKQYGQRGFQVIGISMDDGPQPVRAFYREFRIDYPVALGNVKVAEDYGGILGLPVNLLIDREGRIAVKYAGTTDLPGMEKQIQSLLAEP